MPMPMPVAATWEGGENGEQAARTHQRTYIQLYRRQKATFLSFQTEIVNTDGQDKDSHSRGL